MQDVEAGGQIYIERFSASYTTVRMGETGRGQLFDIPNTRVDLKSRWELAEQVRAGVVPDLFDAIFMREEGRGDFISRLTPNGVWIRVGVEETGEPFLGISQAEDVLRHEALQVIELDKKFSNGSKISEVLIKNWGNNYVLGNEPPVSSFEDEFFGYSDVAMNHFRPDLVVKL